MSVRHYTHEEETILVLLHESEKKKINIIFWSYHSLQVGQIKKRFLGWLDFCFIVTAMLFFLFCRGHANTLWKSSGFNSKECRTCWSCEPRSVLCFPLVLKSRLPAEGSDWPHPRRALPGPQCSVIPAVLPLKRKTAFIWLPNHHTPNDELNSSF